MLEDNGNPAGKPSRFFSKRWQWVRLMKEVGTDGGINPMQNPKP
jgi:hypothetical protein